MTKGRNKKRMRKIRNTLLKISAYIAGFTCALGALGMDAPGNREYHMAVVITILSAIYLAYFYTANKERLSDMESDNL